MGVQATIILDSGVFLPTDSSQVYIEVGYFESDISICADGKPVEILERGLGNSNRRIDLWHLLADGSGETRISLSHSFVDHLLDLRELYSDDQPSVNLKAFDCILRFHSGEFHAADVRNRTFKVVTPLGHIERTFTTKPIANDVVVHYNLEDGEELQLIRDDGTMLLSSSLLSGASHLEIRLNAGEYSDGKYYDAALLNRGEYIWLPNPDPPPWSSGPILPGVSLSPARRYTCPEPPSGHHEEDVPLYKPNNPPRCPMHKNRVLVLKP